MFRKPLLVLLVFVMAIGTMFSPLPLTNTAHAEDYINFSKPPLNNYSLQNPYTHNSDEIDIEATLNNVDGSSIRYTVEQIVDPATEKVGESLPASQSGIQVSGSKMTIIGLDLIPGLNRITFTGTSGGATFNQKVYVKYIDAPTVYDLTIFGAGKELPIKDSGDTIVTPAYVSSPSTGTIFIKGKAPNVNEVTVNIIDINTGVPKGVTVSVNSSDSSFTTQGLTLNPGKNRLQIILRNNDQYTETYRDLVYYDGNVTFYDENVENVNPIAGIPASVPMRGTERLYINDAKDAKITGKVIVPNNYSADQEPLRVTAVYMKAKDFGDPGRTTSRVDEGEQIVIEFNKAVDTGAVGGAPDAKEINKFIGFYYVQGEDPATSTKGQVIEIPLLDERDPTGINQTTAAWDPTGTKYTITLGPADVLKFREAWESTDSKTRNKPFIVFKKTVLAQDGSPGIGAALTIDENQPNGNQLKLIATEQTIKKGDVLLIGNRNTAAAGAAINEAVTNKRWVIYAEGDLVPGAGRDQLHVVGYPGQADNPATALEIPENAAIVHAKAPHVNEVTTPVMDSAPEQVVIASSAGIAADNSYTITLKQADGGSISTPLNPNLLPGDLVKFVDPLGVGTPVYAIVDFTPMPSPSTLKVYAPTGTNFPTDWELHKVDSFSDAGTAIAIGDDLGRTVGKQKINQTFNGVVSSANARLSMNVGSAGKTVSFAPGDIESGDLLEIGTEHVIVGLPYDSEKGTVKSQLGDGATNTSISALPVLGVSGAVLYDNTEVKKVTGVIGTQSTFNGDSPAVDGDQRVGLDGKINLKISETDFTAADKITRGDRIRLGTVYAIAADTVSHTTTRLKLFAPPGALIANGAAVEKITATNTASIGSGVYVNGQVGLGAPGSGSTPGYITFMPGNQGYFVAGSFDSTKPSIIKATIDANPSGTYKVDAGETISIHFQDPKADLLRSPSNVTANLLVEGRGDTASRADLSNLGFQPSLSWPGTTSGNPILKIKMENKGDPFFEDYGYLSLNGRYPTSSGGDTEVSNIPVTGSQAGSDAYAMVLLGKTFDGDPRSPKPDVNHLIGTALDANFVATSDDGVVPNYTVKMVFRDGETKNVIRTISDIQLRVIKGESYNESKDYFVFQFESYNPITTPPDDGGYLPGDARKFNKQYLVELYALNTTLSPPDEQGTAMGELSYTLELPNKPYLHDVNFLAKPVYNGTISEAGLLSSSLGTFTKLENNTAIYNTPLAFEYIVIDPGHDDLTIGQGSLPDTPVALAAAGDFDIEVTSTQPGGDEVDLTQNVADYFITYSSNKAAFGNLTPARDVNGDNRADDVKRVVFMLKKLPFTGTQTLKFTFKYHDGTEVKTQTIERTITYMSGPFVTFTTAYDGQVINRDTTEDPAVLVDEVVKKALGGLKGQMHNVNLTAPDDFTRGDDDQKLYLYINNYETQLEQDPSNLPNGFVIKDAEVVGADGKTEYQRIYEALKSGENTITFYYKSNGPTTKNADIYEKELVIRLVSTNVPVIPVPDTDIYPYPIEYEEPEKNSKRFKGSSGVYSTLEKEFNIYGTFDFIDLGTSRTTIESKLSSLQSTGDDKNYIIVISKNDGSDPWEWNLSNRFTDDKGNVYNSSRDIDPAGLSISYVTSGSRAQSFEFTITNQKMPKDGSKLVYTFKVYNAGKSGPYALYTLEISPTATPYTILRPVPQEIAGSINRNYVEVVIEAVGADSVVINDVEAEMIDFDADNDGDAEYKDVFRAVVMGLKPNKKNTIEFTITKGDETTEGEFEIMYAQDFIPGAEYMEPMKSSHKVFDGRLELKFPKNTYVRRMDPESPNLYKTQVYADHSILFAIANPVDGVVNRYDYVDRPSSFTAKIAAGKQLLQSTFDPHFVQISPLYWIDVGLADDPDTTTYDDVKHGFLPHQMPSSNLPNFNERQEDLMLVPTQRGELTLTFDPNVVTDASPWITVFRFDPEENTWTNIGGVVDAKKGEVTANFDRFGYYVVGKLTHSFTDVTLHPYARNHTEAVYVKGALKPRSDNEFGVDVNITRAEFAAMIVRALAVPLNFDPENLHFDDVPLVISGDRLWDYRHIETAANMGILRGTAPRIFKPDDPITREDASVILARALSLKMETNAAKIEKDLQKIFADYTLISPYSRAAVLAISKKKYVNGSPIDPADPKKGFVFEPKAYLLRGDAAIIMAKIMADLKKLPEIQAVR
ncbi:MAG: S-layer homology domain-containing protein [Brevibacillus sp.]|nr:S-layer homology domain-containing protein [Brevibacillus sp.]